MPGHYAGVLGDPCTYGVIPRYSLQYLAFIVAQLFNILWTLLWAFLLFGGILRPTPDINETSDK